MDDKRLVILDRDGVINEDSDDYIRNEEEWVPLPGSIEAICRLSKAGWLVAVATNQSGLGRGYFDEFALARMHEKMRALVEQGGGEIAGVFFCPHRPDEDCGCRKPRTGLLERIEAEFGMSVAGAWYVGDTEKDVDCALAKGCRPALVLTGKGAQARRKLERDKLARVRVFDDLCAAADSILAETGEAR